VFDDAADPLADADCTLVAEDVELTDAEETVCKLA